MTLRCTRKLLKALDARGPFAPTPSDTVLGDWYANIHDARPWPLALCLNERSLLAVLVQFRDAQSFISRFRQAALALLTRIGIPSDAVAAERRNLAEIAIAPTANRRLIGCLNEAAFAVSIYFDWAEERWLPDHEMYLSNFIYSVTQYQPPYQLARELFDAARPGSRLPKALVH